MKGKRGRVLAVCLAVLLTASAATVGVAVGVPGGGTADGLDGPNPAAQNGSSDVSVTFDNQTVYGDYVTVQSVTIPRQGYVLVRDQNGTPIGYGNVYEGTNRNVTVSLERGLTNVTSPWAKLNVEPNTTETWTATVHFGDYYPTNVDNVSARDTATVTAGQPAEITFVDTSVDPGVRTDSLTVDSVYLPDGGYVHIAARGFHSVGRSEYLSPGVHRDVEVELDYGTGVRSGYYKATAARELRGTPGNLIVVTPYYDDGSPVVDVARVSVGEPPSAAAYANESRVNSSQPVGLFGQFSRDPEGTYLTHRWVQVSGPPVEFFAGGSTTEFTAPAVPRNTTLTFEHTVTDGDGNTDTATVDVRVRPVETAEPNASFAVSNLSAPGDVPPAETMAVSASVTNVGDETATQTVEYRIDSDGNGVTEAVGPNRSVTLAPGENRTVTLDVPTADLPGGTYPHGVFSAGVGQTTRLEAPANGSFYQVDFVAGQPMQLSSDNLYADEDRLVRWLLGNANDGVTDRGTAWATGRVRSCVDAPHIDQQGDRASITFTVAENCSDLTLSLVSYATPPAGFSRETADQQELFDATTETFGPGEHTLTVPLPTGNETDAAESVRAWTP